jgi:hypothetical protein
MTTKWTKQWYYNANVRFNSWHFGVSSEIRGIHLQTFKDLKSNKSKRPCFSPQLLPQASNSTSNPRNKDHQMPTLIGKITLKRQRFNLDEITTHHCLNSDNPNSLSERERLIKYGQFQVKRAYSKGKEDNYIRRGLFQAAQSKAWLQKLALSNRQAEAHSITLQVPNSG